VVADRLPRALLRVEGLAVLGGALAFYFDGGYGWVLLAVLALAPDLSMLGYLAGPRVGALSYDAAHTYVGPVVLAAAGVLAGSELPIKLGPIWLAHREPTASSATGSGTRLAVEDIRNSDESDAGPELVAQSHKRVSGAAERLHHLVRTLEAVSVEAAELRHDLLRRAVRLRRRDQVVSARRVADALQVLLYVDRAHVHRTPPFRRRRGAFRPRDEQTR
jgi:hypothetical protein